MEANVIKCPNCGASSTNHTNCEYCGSLLVRFVEKGIDLTNSSYIDNSRVFPGLIGELQKNLKLQKQYDGEESVSTEICWITKTGVDDYIFVESKGSIDIYEKYGVDNDNNESLKLIVELSFNRSVDPNPEYDSEKDEQFMKFTRLKSFSLFKSFYAKDEDNIWREFEIDFGQDAEGAARLISEILVTVYGLSISDSLGFITGIGDDFWEKEKIWREAHGLDLDDSENYEPQDLTYEAHEDNSKEPLSVWQKIVKAIKRGNSQK